MNAVVLAVILAAGGLTLGLWLRKRGVRKGAMFAAVGMAAAILVLLMPTLRFPANVIVAVLVVAGAGFTARDALRCARAAVGHDEPGV